MVVVVTMAMLGVYLLNTISNEIDDTEIIIPLEDSINFAIIALLFIMIFYIQTRVDGIITYFKQKHRKDYN